MPTGQEVVDPQEETQVKKNPKRPKLHEEEDPHTKKILQTLEDQEKVAIDKVLKESLQWQIRIIK